VWDQAFDTELRALIGAVVTAGDRSAWRQIMLRIAPRLEAWARASRVLRRCRLASADDARTVMVDVLERLAADDHANLKRFVAHSPEPAGDDDDLVAEVVRLGKLDEDEPVPRDESVGTPFRAWLLRLVDFTARDHVRRRLGWIPARPGEPTKRDLHTDAAPLDGSPEPAARPPMTDRLTMAKLVDEVRALLATFPVEMSAAVRLWLEDVDFADIATQLDLADAARARALVRSGQARLRERFRGRSPLLFA
jgi:DNA-directed RNA polymerase specialized sigma24 family protein